MNVCFFFLEIDRLYKMSVAELFAVNHFSVIILNDQPEFGSSRIFQLYTENYAVIICSNVLNSYLLFAEDCGLFTTIGLAGQRIANEKNNSCYCDSNCFYYTGAYKISVHIIILYFTKLNSRQYV